MNKTIERVRITATWLQPILTWFGIWILLALGSAGVAWALRLGAPALCTLAVILAASGFVLGYFFCMIDRTQGFSEEDAQCDCETH